MNRVDPSDASLVTSAISGDQVAFERLIRRHIRAAYATAIALTRSPQDAEDVCQEALVTAYHRLSECRGPDRFRQWLIQIVRNRAHNYRRHEALRETVALDVAPEAAARDSPGQDVERRELRAQLLTALQVLSPTQRAVVVLHDLEGLTHREIGESLGVSELMARRHLTEARRKLRSVLSQMPGCEQPRLT
jgi:RNA polymerase sigma-70 factor, ECF subfamily